MGNDILATLELPVALERIADYITKPFQILEVLARVEHQLALGRLQRQLEAVRALSPRLDAASARLSAGVAALGQGDQACAPGLLAELAQTAQAIEAAADELRRLTGAA